MLGTLAQQVENLQGGTNPRSTQSEGTASLIMDIDDLKRKAARFQEAIDRDKRALDSLIRFREQAQHLETKMEAWQLRFPLRSLGEEWEDVQSSIELQAEFEHFKQQDRRRMPPEAIANLEARMNLPPPRVPTDVSWEAVSDRVASEITRASETLNERMVTELERAIQTLPNSSPATSSEQSRVVQEDIRRLDSRVEVSLRAFSREVEELREWMTQAIGEVGGKAKGEGSASR